MPQGKCKLCLQVKDLQDVVVLVIVCTDSISRKSFFPQSLGKKDSDRTYIFMAKGLNLLSTSYGSALLPWPHVQFW